jgi:hypothetical protein
MAGFLRGAWSKITILAYGAFPVLIFQVTLLALPWLIRNQSLRWVFLVAFIFLLALFSETWTHPHYAAPAAGMVLLLIVQGIRAVRSWRWRNLRIGVALVRVSILVSIFGIGIYCVQLCRAHGQGWHMERARILRQLREQGGRHLVIVHYFKDHSPHEEWVYNEADIDRSAVVWARDMGWEQNQDLLAHFQDRHVWFLAAYPEQPELLCYPPWCTHP